MALQARPCHSGERMQVRDNRPLLVALGRASAFVWALASDRAGEPKGLAFLPGLAFLRPPPEAPP